MPLVRIATIDDTRLAPYRNLKQTNLTRWSGRFIAEGRLVVERLLASDFPVESVLLSERRLEAWRELNPRDDVEVLVVPEELAAKLVGFQFHAGMMACGVRPNAPRLDELARADNALLVACPRMTDPDNLGGLIRLGRAFGAAGLLLGDGCADPFSRRTLRVSMGNAFELPILECADLASDLKRMRSEHGFQLSATVLAPGAEPLHAARRFPREVLLLGNEADGLEHCWIELSDRRLTIPMQEGCDSLNVTVAAGIFLHHLTSVAFYSGEGIVP
jgi:tRNA G18 (ribose-2'-O)-methylase SpoU